MKATVALFIGILAAASGQVAAPRAPLALRQTIALPGVDGRIDHLALDTDRDRLFIAALGNNTVEVLDLAKGTRSRTLSGFHEPQGIAMLADLHLVAVANGGSGDAVLLDARTGSVAHTVRLSDDADNVRYDAKAKRVYVAHGSGAISGIDATTGKVLDEVRLPGHPESFQLERDGRRIYANVPAAGSIAVIDRDSMKVTATWSVTSAKANYPMALDEEGRRLFVGCRQPSKVLVYDTRAGRQVGASDICGDTDDLFYDPARRRLYVSCGEGFLDVFQQQANGGWLLSGRLPTAAGARTSLYVPQQNRLYLAVPHRGSQQAEIRVFEARD